MPILLALHELYDKARTALAVAGVVALALIVGEVHGHSRGVADDQAAGQKEYIRVLGENTDLAVSNAQDEQRIKDLTANAHPEVPNVDFYIPAPGLATVALPDPGYTNEFVCLWNVPIRAASDPSGTSDARACTHPPDAFSLSGATRDDILNNAIENFGRCALVYRRLDALQHAVQNATGGGHE